MTYEEAAKKVACVVPWISLHRHDTGEAYVMMNGEYDPEDLLFILKTIEAIEK